MPSLLPKKQLNTDAPAAEPVDLGRVFDDPACAETLGRVVAYVRQVEQKFSDRSREELDRKNVVTEEFFLCMPTLAALLSEVDLCRAVVAHSEKVVPDEAVRNALNDFIDAHTFVYRNDSRDVKKGDFSPVPPVELFYLSDETRELAWTCNHFQMRLLMLIYSENSFLPVVRL